MLKRIASLSLLSVFAFAAACTSKVPLGTAPSASTPDGSKGTDGSTPTGPWNLTCTTYWRAAGTTNDLAPQKFTARSDATTKQTLTYADAAVDFDLAPASDAPETEALLTVTTPTQKSVQTYRISRTRRPTAQFAGDHGFTGLVYVGGVDLQYICESEGSSPPAREANAVPLDVICQIELRSAPGGPVEKRDTLTYTPDITGAGPDKSEAIAYQDDLAFTMTGSDSAIEGRFVKVGISRSPLTPGGEDGVAQLFQLDRNAVLLNQLVGTTFTGRVAVTAANNKELSYACSSRSSSVGGGDDPTCTTHDVNVQRDDVPTTCTVSGATCAFKSGGIASCNKPGAKGYSSIPNEYNCTCTDGNWHCNIVGGGLGVLPCPGAELGPTCSNGTNTCDVTGCASDEVCFTQVSCGPASPDAGAGTCTLGSNARADNTCHRSCTDSSTCATGQECVKKQFFACSDFDGPAEGRGICCLKGSSCE